MRLTVAESVRLLLLVTTGMAGCRTGEWEPLDPARDAGGASLPGDVRADPPENDVKGEERPSDALPQPPPGLPCVAPTGCDPLVGTSAAHPPWGIWALATLYGPSAQPVSPTPPLQVEIRPDGTTYHWICAGAPSDGSLTEPCPRATRMTCATGTATWDGFRWKLTYANPPVIGVPGLGHVTPDGKGNIIVGYIYYTSSAGLLRRVAEPDSGGPGCTP